MVDLGWKAQMVSPKSPKLSNKLRVSIPIPNLAIRSGSAEISPACDAACSAYEHYLRLPDLKKLWDSTDFPNWPNEGIIKPGFQALELTYRFVSTVLSDPRPYVNRREWKRRLESLATTQIEIIAALCEDEEEDPETRGTTPLVDIKASNGVVSRENSLAEVWKLSGAHTAVVSRVSEMSLLSRLATWQKSEDVAQKILYTIECEFSRCPYTLGLGEPNLTGKPSLDYDSICKPNELHSLKTNPHNNQIKNNENQILYTTHQILESWIHVAQKLLERITQQIAERNNLEKVANNCHLLERIWKLLADIEDLHLQMDPADFLKLKNELSLNEFESESKSFCFRSRLLVEVARQSKELRNKVPLILNVEVDPKGGPRIQEAAMKLYSERTDFDKIHVLQGLQAIESAMKRFFYAYKQVLVVVMGSLEANGGGNRCDSLSQVFLEPTYFPSLDGAKTFLGDFFSHEYSNKQ